MLERAGLYDVGAGLGPTKYTLSFFRAVVNDTMRALVIGAVLGLCSDVV